ncbi:MAG: hypothetical protein KAT11_06330, partial [Phycisphaerae bacterium]|nr:hypothetical protein [Phycisphaerae bacterium]
DLTLRQLHIIEEKLIKSLCSVYHARVAYPESKAPDKANKLQPKNNAAASAGKPSSQTARPAKGEEKT